MAVVWVIEQMDEPPPGLAVAFTVAEEGMGDLRGARAVCAELEPEAVIALEGHGLDEVMIDHVGSVRARVVVAGPGGHSWWDRETPSAVHALVEIASGLVAHSANLSARFQGASRSTRSPAGRSSWWSAVRCPSTIWTSSPRCSTGFGVDPPLQLESGAGGQATGRPNTARIIPWSPPCAGCESASVLPDRLGSGSTDANAAVAVGIPAVALGCARGSGMHSRAERIDLRSLEFGCVQVVEVMRELAR